MTYKKCPQYCYNNDFEKSGMRAYEGAGVVTVGWAHIDKVLIGDKKTDVKPYRLEGQIVLKNAARPRKLIWKWILKKGCPAQQILAYIASV